MGVTSCQTVSAAGSRHNLKGGSKHHVSVQDSSPWRCGQHCSSSYSRPPSVMSEPVKSDCLYTQLVLVPSSLLVARLNCLLIVFSTSCMLDSSPDVPHHTTTSTSIARLSSLFSLNGSKFLMFQPVLSVVGVETAIQSGSLPP